MANGKGMQCLLLGYSGYIQIYPQESDFMKSYPALLTSYSLTRNFNIIKSSANLFMPLYYKYLSNKNYQKFARDIVVDFPQHELSLGLEANFHLVKMLLKELKKYSFRRPLNINFYDDTVGISFQFDNFLVTSFSFNIQNNSIATISLSGSIFQREINFNFIKPEVKNHAESHNADSNLLAGGMKKTDDSDQENKSYKLMPYWAFQAEHSNINNLGLMGFTINFSHQLNPKYACRFTDKPAPPSKVIFSVPTITYECNYILNDTQDLNDDDLLPESKYVNLFQQNNIDDDLTENKFKIAFGGKDLITLRKCYVDNIVPSVANSGSVNTLSISGTAYEIDHTDDENEEELD